jgi:hypothetical protein
MDHPTVVVRATGRPEFVIDLCCQRFLSVTRRIVGLSGKPVPVLERVSTLEVVAYQVGSPRITLTPTPPLAPLGI